MSIDEKYSIKQSILNYARTYGRIEVPQLVSVLGIKTNTARQYLCTLTKENKIARTGISASTMAASSPHYNITSL